MLTNAVWHNACISCTDADASRKMFKVAYTTKGRACAPPHFQLISCMEIIFKTEQNGGPSLSGRVGLCRAPRAGWHVTVYACLLNKRCWPRWKSAIGHLICPTSVIGSWPNTQHSCPLRVEVLVYSMQKLYTKIYRYLGGGCIWDELLIILGAVYKCLLIFC